MPYSRIRDLTLGSLAAEHDQALENYFYESRMYHDVSRGRTKILIGNRGSGKSAIFKILAKKEKGQGTLVQEITPTDFMYDLLTNTRQFDMNAEWARLGAYTTAWKYVMLVTAMRLLHGRYKKLKVEPEHVNRIKAFLRDHTEEHQCSPVDLLVLMLKKFANVSRVSFEGIQFSDTATELDRLYKLNHLQPVIPSIQELSKHSRVLILFDELDHGWDASDDARQFIAGLFRAAIYINQHFSHLDVLVTIREEIYQNIPELYDDAQKIRDIIEHIRWTPEELKMLISQRIKHAWENLLEKRLNVRDPDRLWEMIFEPYMNDGKTSTFDYIIDHTLYRPRELIFFVNECLKVHNLETRIGQATIEKVMRGYSKNRLDDIAAEYKFQYPGLREVFETFRLSDPIWNREQLEEHWLEIIEGIRQCPEASSWLNGTGFPNKLIEVLWKVGFLRVYMQWDASSVPESDVPAVGYFQEPTLNISMYNYFDIHPMFRPHLGIRNSFPQPN
ncbi:MAG: hypothetical protein D6732_04270 [Methanobacteriota archaeon]|nr:MAG: hypothetical protein D6732_04270 [Euryarchaeota archaeon]